MHARIVRALRTMPSADPAECMVHAAGAAQWQAALPEALRPIMAQQPIGGWRLMLHDTEYQRPDLWKHLQSEIKAAIVFRTERSSDSMDWND